MTLTPSRPCPKCKSGTLDERIKRGFFVKYALFWVPYKRYICYTCRRKSYIVDSKAYA